MSQVEGRAIGFLAYPPEEVVASNLLLEEFHKWILQAAPDVVQKLMPDAYKVSRRGDQEIVSRYFQRKEINPSDRLKTSATFLSKAVSLSEKEYTEVWSSSSPRDDFKTHGTIDPKRMHRIMQGIDLLEKRIALASCALRFSYLFLNYHIEQIIGTTRPEELAWGRGKKTIVYEQLARHFGEDSDKIYQRCKKARKYLSIAKVGGIGLLLVLGSQTWSFEGLAEKDVERLCDFRRDCLPHLQARCEQLNVVAAQLILEGFWKYGWNYRELTDDQSGLMNLLRPYIDLDQLLLGYIVIRHQSHFPTGVLGEVDADIRQQFLEFQQSGRTHDHGPPETKRRKILRRESQTLELRKLSFRSTFTARTPGDDIDRATSDVEPRPHHVGEVNGPPGLSRRVYVMLLSDWPPRWTYLDVLDGSVDGGQEVRESLPARQPGSRASEPDIEATVESIQADARTGELSSATQSLNGEVNERLPEHARRDRQRFTVDGSGRKALTPLPPGLQRMDHVEETSMQPMESQNAEGGTGIEDWLQEFVDLGTL